jgi:protein transport protein SEC61 subunit gamma-like protein
MAISFDNIIGKIKAMFREYARVLRVTKKPTAEEFKTIMKVSGLGILALGLIGFLLQMIRYLLLPIK